VHTKVGNVQTILPQQQMVTLPVENFHDFKGQGFFFPIRTKKRHFVNRFPFVKDTQNLEKEGRKYPIFFEEIS
jgi:hypothetical protein